MEDPKQALMAANLALALAADMVRQHMPIIDAFLKEQESVDAVMPIVDPSGWMNEERRQTAALLDPLFRSAKAFVHAVETAREAAVDQMAERAARG